METIMPESELHKIWQYLVYTLGFQPYLATGRAQELIDKGLTHQQITDQPKLIEG